MFHCDTIICDLLKTQLSFQGIPYTFSNLSTKSSRKWFNKYKYFRLGFIVFLLNSCDKNVMMLSIIDTKYFRIPKTTTGNISQKKKHLTENMALKTFSTIKRCGEVPKLLTCKLSIPCI
jgi:hypothetical protein